MLYYQSSIPSSEYVNNKTMVRNVAAQLFVEKMKLIFEKQGDVTSAAHTPYMAVAARDAFNAAEAFLEEAEKRSEKDL